MDERLPGIVNALATVKQLTSNSSEDNGLDVSTETLVLFTARFVTQAAGSLLKLEQDTIARAIIYLSRVYTGANDISNKSTEVSPFDVSAACTYLAAKNSALPRSPRSIINVYEWLSSIQDWSFSDEALAEDLTDQYWVSESRFQKSRALLHKTEALVLRSLGFRLDVALPHPLVISYLQTLDAFSSDRGKVAASYALRYLNTALISPQLLYLTHQPNELAAAAIFLASRDANIKLPELAWWQVFDCEREELAFIAVAILSTQEYARDAKELGLIKNVSVRSVSSEKT